MLSKKNRADKSKMKQVFSEGHSVSMSNLNFKYTHSKGKEEAKISLIAPKTISKYAVKRNSLRRRGYRILRKYIADFPRGLVGAFIYKKYQEDNSILENEIKEAINKIH